MKSYHDLRESPAEAFINNYQDFQDGHALIDSVGPCRRGMGINDVRIR